MDFLLNRYRNITVLLVVIIAQLLLLAYQVKTNKDVPLFRVWAVSAVTPVEEALEFTRRHTIGYVEDYFVLVNVREQNAKLKKELDKTKLENHFLRSELSTAERAKQLATFQQQTPSKTLAARVIGNGTGANSKVVFIDRGSSAGVESGMAVITPDGIVGKVVAAYPTASLVMLITDPSFAAGVVSQNHHVHGTLKGQGGPKCKIAYVQNEEKVDVGEMFFTSGDDGVFPRGFPAGQVTSAVNGRSSKEIYVTPAGWQGGLDEVLVITEGVHQPIPEQRIASAPVAIMPPPADEGKQASAQAPPALSTAADKLRSQYEQVGQQENVKFGMGNKAPDFSKVGQEPKPGAPATRPVTPGQPPQAQPATPGAATVKPKARPPANPDAADAADPDAPLKPRIIFPKPATPVKPPPTTPRTDQ